MRHPYIDVSDMKEIIDNLRQDHPTNDNWEEGYFTALEDIEYALQMNGLSGVEFHLQQWDGFLARSQNDHGYMNALYDFQQAVQKLIDERKD